MIGAALAWALVVAGCGPAPEPVNEIRIGIVLEPPNLDPTSGAAAAIDEVTYANIFEGLTRIREDGSVAPALAKTWEISPDGRVYLFRLRADVRFHDGTSFDASDVKFTLDRARATDSANAQKALFEPIEAVEVLDPLSVRVTLTRPVGDFLFNMGWGDAVIVAPESAATNASKPIGTGPLRFARWMKGTMIELERNTDYWGTPVAFDRARFFIIPDPSAAYAALLAGDVDGFPDFPAPELLSQIDKDQRFRIVKGTTEGETILAINNGKPPFNDVRVRRAIQAAIDRKALIDGVMFGDGTPIGSHFAPHHPAYVDLTAKSPYDPAKARALLAEAGVAPGMVLILKLPPPPYARRGGEVIASQLRSIGFDVRIESIEWAQWLDQVFKNRDYDLTIVSHTEPMDIGIYRRKDYYFAYDSPAFDAVMDELDREQNETRRRALLGDAQAILAADAVNAFLFQLPKIGVWRADLEGQWRNSPVQANDLTGIRRKPSGGGA